jgi:RimJ/RimL family protein N-acetyltransferase
VQNPFRIGKRTYLRPVEKSDAPTVARWANDERVTRTVLMHRPMSVGSEEAFLAEANSPTMILMAIMAIEGDRHVGMIGLHQIDPKNQCALFGMMIGEVEEWGKGHGSEALALALGFAFDTLNLARVYLEVFPDNVHAIRMYEKAGFVREGLFRSHVYRLGGFSDVIYMGLLRGEWRRPRTADR